MARNPNPDPHKHLEVPIWNQEDKYYEDYIVPEVDRSISRTISEGEVMLFNSLVLDMHPYVGDDIFARRKGIFGRRIVPGAMVFSYGLGLMATNNVHAFSYGYDRLRFIKPAFIGDTIYTMRTLLDKWPKYETMGLFRVSYEVFRADDGELLLYCEHLQTVEYRDPAAAGSPSELVKSPSGSKP
jgi:acyl dehydratase